MVAFAKPHLKPHTRCGSAKDSGHRFYSAEISRWLNRDPMGEEGGPNTYTLLRNSSVQYTDYLGLIPNPLHLTKIHVSPTMCATVKGLMDVWAVGRNQELWNIWKSAVGGTHMIKFSWFDPGGAWRQFHMNRALADGLKKARKLKCTGCGTMKYFGYSNPKNTITYMLWYWELKVECDTEYSAKWDYACCKCETVTASSRCKYVASDMVDFWDDPNKKFLLPPYIVDDQFIRGCNYGGKGFKVRAIWKPQQTLTRPCVEPELPNPQLLAL